MSRVHNRSQAVMAQRVEAHDSLDDFPTPAWATRALIEHILAPRMDVSAAHVWEPACNRGFMAAALEEYFAEVLATDIKDYSADPAPCPNWRAGRADAIGDFLMPGQLDHLARVGGFAGAIADYEGPRWIVTNPPFRLAAEFIARSRALVVDGLALFVRGAFLEGEDRWRAIYSKRPPAIHVVFAERVVLLRGRCVARNAIDPGSARPGTKASSATAYSWLVFNDEWLDAQGGRTVTEWIPPCSSALTRPGDYPEYPPGYFPDAPACPADGPGGLL